MKTVQCFLVHPGKNEHTPLDIRGADVPLQGKLHKMLLDIFDNAERECQIEISFNAASDGSQQNDCRDLILAYLQETSIERGKELAKLLQRETNRKSGMGLLFLMTSESAGIVRFVISRFPADEGILAEENQSSLSVAFLEKVFMKNASSYKCAFYKGSITDGEFWKGRAVDKQINYDQLANYWIRGFLASDLLTTGAAGTRRLAIALREAMKNASPQDKSALAAAATLAAKFDGKTLSAQDFCDHFGLSDSARESVRKSLKQERLMGDLFVFSQQEFSQNIAFRTVELDNGAVLTADASRFDGIFSQEFVAEESIRYTTVGRVTNERLRNSK